MSNMAEYARIFDTGTSDEWVEKRKSAVAEAKAVYEGLKPQAAISTASIIAASIADGAPLPESISTEAERVIQNHASSFVRSAVVRRNSVNSEPMYSKEGPVRVDRFMPTRTDMILSTRISATQICQLAFSANPGVKWGQNLNFHRQ